MVGLYGDITLLCLLSLCSPAYHTHLAHHLAHLSSSCSPHLLLACHLAHLLSHLPIVRSQPCASPYTVNMSVRTTVGLYVHTSHHQLFSIEVDSMYVPVSVDSCHCDMHILCHGYPFGLCVCFMLVAVQHDSFLYSLCAHCCSQLCSNQLL